MELPSMTKYILSNKYLLIHNPNFILSGFCIQFSSNPSELGKLQSAKLMNISFVSILIIIFLYFLNLLFPNYYC